MTASFDKYFFSLFSEETIDNMFRNPENNALSLNEVLGKFEQGGGTILGTGYYATALAHPKWNYVVKIFNDDSAYLAYARYCFKNQNNPCVPKFLDKPRKIVPNFTRSWLDRRVLYYVKMEKLEPMDKHPQSREIYQDMRPYFVTPLIDAYSKEQILSMDENNEEITKGQQKIIRSFKNNKNLPWLYDYCKLIHDIDMIADRTQSTNDMHEGNIMARQDGTLVITDPLSFREDIANADKNKKKVREQVYQLLTSNPDFSRKVLEIKGGENPSQRQMMKRLNRFNRLQEDQ